MVFLAIGGAFMSIAGFVMFPADLWFLQYGYTLMGVLMLIASGFVLVSFRS
jgi:hypothetical protein|tara:strand:- start:685 stop:837 length:153 start_codon:yes stop_codon:yes gene_type:complete